MQKENNTILIKLFFLASWVVSALSQPFLLVNYSSSWKKKILSS